MHGEEEITKLAARVSALERANRRLFICSGVLLTVLVSLLAMGSAPGQREILEAGGIIIRDPAGTPRISMGIGDAGAEVALRDTAGILRLVLASEAAPSYVRTAGHEAGPAVILTGPSPTPGNHKLALESNEFGSGLWVWEGQQGPQVTLGVSLFDAEMTPQLVLRGLKESSGSVLATVSGELPSLWFPGPSICIRNPRGDCVFHAP